MIRSYLFIMTMALMGVICATLFHDKHPLIAGLAILNLIAGTGAYMYSRYSRLAYTQVLKS